MDTDTLFRAIAGERRRLAQVLDELDAAQLQTPSLCDGWSVRDVAAHLVMPLVVGMPVVGLALLRERGSFARANRRVTASVVARHGEDLPNLLRQHATHRFAPPGAGPIAPLTDLLVHGQDIGRPLGLRRDFDADHLRAALDFLSTPRARFFAPCRAPVVWEASDIGWRSGDGAPVVSGPAEAILLARTGRRVGYDELDGAGVDLLPR